jgi:hypothetical protein
VNGLLTFAEFVKLSDPLTGQYELRHGRLVHRPPRKKLHLKIQHALFDLLSPLTPRARLSRHRIPVSTRA